MKQILKNDIYFSKKKTNTFLKYKSKLSIDLNRFFLVTN